MKKNIGIIGGSFNPIHYGHLRVAEEAREALGLDRILFVPTYIAPHKQNKAAPDALVDAKMRLEMTRLAVASSPYLDTSDIEVKRGGVSYTATTLRELSADAGTVLTLILGADQFNEINTWCEYEEILKMVDIAVVNRPGVLTKTMAEALPVELAKKFWYDTEKSLYTSDFGRSVYFLNTMLMSISSTDIRERVREGLSIKYLLPPEVEEYIKNNGLYK